MFEKKQPFLIEGVQTAKKSNSFIKESLKKGAETRTGNDALKYSATDNEFVTQYNKLGDYRNERSYKEIASDMIKLTSIDVEKAIKFTIFIRMISRKTLIYGENRYTENVQKGAGLKHEALLRMLWLQLNTPDEFWLNHHLFLSAGSLKDIFELLSLDLQYNGWENRQLDWERYKVVVKVLLHEDLFLKYLPQIKSKTKCKTLRDQSRTIIGKWICSFLKIDYRSYRKKKSAGKAHNWQQHISKKEFSKINFQTIHGRALMLLANSKFLENQNLLPKYIKWIKEQPVAKFTGYPYELAKRVSTTDYKNITIDKQYESLLKTAKDNVDTNSKLIVVRDISRSMTGFVKGANTSARIVATSLAILFGDMLTGAFHNHVINFNHKAVLKKWVGQTFSEKIQADNDNFIGPTNFQSVIDLFCTLKVKGVPEGQFPSGIVCISDGEFNKTPLDKTNLEEMDNKLRKVFSQKYVENFKLILWDIPTNYYGHREAKFESYSSIRPGVFYLSGFDGSILGFLLNKKDKNYVPPKNAEELVNKSLDQELLNLVKTA